MKKTIVACILAMLLALSACGSATANEDNILVISERFFVARFTDILANTDRYLGYTIQFEGLFLSGRFGGETFYMVIRYILGCCTIDPIGLEVLLEDFAPLADETWVEVTGVLEELDGFLVLRATSLIELSEQGAAFIQ